jgi:hypothetical protein
MFFWYAPLVDVHSTDRGWINPFADTDPRVFQREVVAAIIRAQKRKAIVPRPRAYWEEPGVHGSGRAINLHRGPAPRPVSRSRRYGASSKLPAHPNSGFTIGHAAIIGSAALAIGGLVWWLKRRHDKQQTTHVGEDFCGLDLLGCEP